ncbi:MAG TPA: site-specific integrase [Candidatus Hydrogenedentes bacterium]|nr:site-specific integrase [Candidatus Hydrogenedentota bacterium]
MAGLYKRNGVYYISYYEAGKRHMKSLGTRNRKDATKFKEAIERRLAQKKWLPETIDTPCKVFWDKYLEWAEAHKRPRTIETERLHWGHLREFCKRKSLKQYERRDFEEFKLHRRQLGNGPVAVNNALKHLQAIFNHAIKLGYFSGPNPVQGVERFKVEKRPPRFLNQEQIEKLLAAAEEYNENVFLGIALGVYAGMRRREISFATWEWINFDRKLISIVGDGHFAVKDWEARTLPLHGRLAEILWPRRRPDGYILAPEAEPGVYRYRYDFRKVFDAVKRQVGPDWLTVHVLRHTFASQLAAAGVSLYKIAQWLGHANVKTTQIYAHLQAHDEDINRF